MTFCIILADLCRNLEESPPPPMVEVLISQSGQVVKKIVEVGGQNCRFPGVKRVVRESEAVTFKGRMEQKKWQ